MSTTIIAADRKRFYKTFVLAYNGCWIWLGTLRGGYGRFRCNGKIFTAHRISWELNFGEIPQGKFVLHRCDNPQCVNPSHLFLGTIRDNNRDRAEKGRSNRPKGLLNGRCKLTEAQIQEIRSDKRGCLRLSKQYGVSTTQIKRIRNRREWSHV